MEPQSPTPDPKPPIVEPPPLTLALKGICMGLADVIPGVSGGTVALILGIYQDFIDSIRSINPKPLLALWRWIISGFGAEGKAAFIESLATIRLRFLIPLGVGLVGAIGVGSLFIPTLMESFPELMRGLFFGLIVASLAVPFGLIPKDNRARFALAMLLAAVAATVGYLLTDPNRVVNMSDQWVEVTAPAGEEPEELKSVIRRGPSALTSEQVYWAEKNEALRAAIAKADPDQAKTLADEHSKSTGVAATDKNALKALAKPYDALKVPAGTVLMVPRPSYAFIFLAGAIAICAMVLPGISGSFLLLILGVYYFVLNTLKGVLTQLVHLEFPVESLIYLTLFILGITVGILSFARVLSWFLKRYPGFTMGVLMGLMAGCTRAIWPFQQTLDGKVTNIVPTQIGSLEIGAMVAAIVGAALVMALSALGRRSSKEAT